VSLLCKIAEVSRSGYYKHVHAAERSNGDEEVALRIKNAQEEVRFTYGAKRMAKQLSPAGARCHHRC